jgi:hypothetical protein
MTAAPEQPDLAQEAAARNYFYFCATALLVMWVALMAALRPSERWWSAFPVLVGFMALIVRWRWAPSMLLVALLGIFSRDVFWQLTPGPWMPTRGAAPLTELILGASVLAFVAGNYRYQGLVNYIFPPDSRIPRAVRQLARLRRTAPGGQKSAIASPPSDLRRPVGKPKGKPVSPFAPSASALPGHHQQTRSHQSVAPAEMMLLALSVPVWVILAYSAWRLLILQQTDMDMPDSAYRGMLLVWILGIGLLASWGAFSYLRWLALRPEEAALLLQDTLWRETRREQARLNRWIVWARRKTQSRKDKP